MHMLLTGRLPRIALLLAAVSAIYASGRWHGTAAERVNSAETAAQAYRQGIQDYENREVIDADDVAGGRCVLAKLAGDECVDL